jgi:hypothetical protein
MAFAGQEGIYIDGEDAHVVCFCPFFVGGVMMIANEGIQGR